MCLAVPLKIERLTGPSRAHAGRDGVQMDIDVSLVPGVRPGQYVIVHAGFAIQIVEDEDAEERLELFRAIADASDRKA